MEIAIARYRRFYLLLFVVPIVLSVTIGRAQTSKREVYRQQLNQSLTAEAINADVDYFYQALQAAHPDLYRYLPRQEFDAAIESIKARASELTLRQFYNELNWLSAQVGCGHLLISYPTGIEKYLGKYVFYPPLHLVLRDSHLVVKKTLLPTYNFDDARVTAINGIPVDTLLKKISLYVTHDGYNKASNVWMLEQGWFNELYLRFLTDSNTYHYTLQTLTDSGWAQQHVALDGFDYKRMKLPRKKPAKPKPQLQLKFDEDTYSAILTLKSFDPVAIKRGKQKFHKFLRESFWLIAQENPEQIVIDLRNNEGGNSFYPEALISFLSKEPFRLYRKMEIRYAFNSNYPLVKIKGKRAYKKMDKHGMPSANGNKQMPQFTGRFAPGFPMAYTGNIYVLVNGGTYSAASELACYLKDRMGATVVGTETGGSCDPVTAGMYGKATLPNTGIVVNIPLITFEKDLKAAPQPGRGLSPDVYQHQWPNDSIIDPELNFLLDYIGQQKRR